MNRTRGERRHFDRKQKRKAKEYFENVLYGYYDYSERDIGIRARTRVPCSDTCCGNRRMGMNGHYNKTRQELLSDLEMKEELELYYQETYDRDYYWRNFDNYKRIYEY